ncbi:MAG: Segregation and condensation protein B [Pseudidiomarina mangrovi]|nr:MAG: Segregation and condensation protein B [Pseudidiomarina mangrovi]
MQQQQLKQALEALLFVAEQPLTEAQLLQHFSDSLGADVVSRKQLQQTLAELQSDYAERGVQLCKVASGYRFQTRAELGGIISQLWQEKPPRYSQALLETLALVAYRQPITRGDIEAIRGVSVSSQIIKTLQERGWIKVVGHREVPGRPQLYATTNEFLDYFGLQDLSQLPDIPAAATASPIAETAPKQE